MSSHRGCSIIFQRSFCLDNGTSCVLLCKLKPNINILFSEGSLSTGHFRKHLKDILFGVGNLNLPVLLSSSAEKRSYTPLVRSQPYPYLRYLSLTGDLNHCDWGATLFRGERSYHSSTTVVLFNTENPISCVDVQWGDSCFFGSIGVLITMLPCITIYYYVLLWPLVIELSGTLSDAKSVSHYFWSDLSPWVCVSASR